MGFSVSSTGSAVYYHQHHSRFSVDAWNYSPSIVINSQLNLLVFNKHENQPGNNLQRRTNNVATCFSIKSTSDYFA